AARRAAALRMVAGWPLELAIDKDIMAVFRHLRRGRHVDDLGAKVSLRSHRRRMEPNAWSAAGGCGGFHLVLPRKTGLASSPDFFVSAMERERARSRIFFANSGRAHQLMRFVVVSTPGTSRILCVFLFRCFAIPCPGFLRRLLLPLL